MSSNHSLRMKQFFPVTDTNPQICIDSVHLVKEVKKHPIIYDSWIRRDQFAVFAAWEEIIEALLPGFRGMRDNDKMSIRKKFRMRWSWMRSTLRRDLTRNKIFTHIHYKWMEELQFLVPFLLKRENSLGGKQRVISPNTQNFVTSTTETPSPSHVNGAASPDPDECLIDAFITTFAFDGLTAADPDKNFLFAVLNAFRRLSDGRKEVLKSSIIMFFQE